MLGHAIGVLGMSVSDFESLTPEEFTATCRAWSNYQEDMLHGDWERMRMLATITVQPHVKGKMTPQKLLPLPWESPKKPPREKMSAREHRQRMKDAISKMGDRF